MEMVALEPDFITRLQGASTWRVYLSGEIDGRAPEQLERLVNEHSVPWGSNLYIHSGGGGAVSGMALGRVIRKYGLTTHVGRQGKQTTYLQETDDGFCMSAAALAFLGGIWRYVDGESRYGVHQFTGLASADEAQRLSTEIVDYIRSMGVSTELFTYAAETPADDILELPHATLRRLNVANHGYDPVEWSVESIDVGVYLKGQRDTVIGVQKFILFFPPGQPVGLHAIFQGGQNAETIMGMQTERLAIDDEYISLSERRIERVNDNTWINGIYALSNDIIDKLKTAKQVGYVLQFSDEAPMFCGFDGFSFEGGAALLPGLLTMHAASNS